MTIVNHSLCLLLDSCAQPAWTLTISALDCQLDPQISRRYVGLISTSLNRWLNTDSNRGIIKFVPLNESNLGRGGITIGARIEELEEKEKRSEVSSAGAAGIALKKAFTRSRNPIRSSPPKNEKTQPQTPTKPPVKFDVPSSDSMKPPSPLNKNENTTRWPTPTTQHQADAVQDENQRPKVSSDAMQSSKSGHSSTQPITQPTEQKRLKKRKSLYQLLRRK